MKGKNPSYTQHRYWDLLARYVGCIACHKEFGARNYEVSIHHVDGRTKPDAHWLVLPLCAGHHQDGTGAPGLIAVHPWKRRFEDKFGSQEELISECCDQLENLGYDIQRNAKAALFRAGYAPQEAA